MAPTQQEQGHALIAARVRAALAYSDRSYAEVAKGVPGLGVATLRRITSPTNPRGASLHELVYIARACEVPQSWLLRGEWQDGGQSLAMPFDEIPGTGSTARRLDVVEHYLRHLLGVEQGRSGSVPQPDEPMQRAVTA